MPNPASFYPSDYVRYLRSLVVPGYAGYDGGVVAITQYSSANQMFGGAQASRFLAAQLWKVATAAEKTFLDSEPAGRVWSGQGMGPDFVTILTIVMAHRAELATVPELKRYMDQTDYLQALCDAAFLGMDCIGFVGTYTATCGIDAGYKGRTPLAFAPEWSFVQTLKQVTDLSIIMLTNGLHIQIIDRIITEIDRKPEAPPPQSVTVDICQSSHHKTEEKSRGPQCNRGVVITAGGGDYTPVETFRAQRTSKSEWDKYVATLPPAEQAKADRTSPNDGGYQGYLRKHLTEHSRAKGYMGGAIFKIAGNGTPPNPVAQSIYIGVMPGLVCNKPRA